MNRIKLVLIFTVVLVTSILVFRQSSGTKGIFIAANLPLTGDLALYGQAIKSGFELARKDWEQNNHKSIDIDVDWGDNRFNSTDAVSVLQKQKQKNPSIYISGLKPQVMSIENNVECPHFEWIPDMVFNKENDANRFRTWISLSAEADVFTQYLEKIKPTRLSIIIVETPAAIEEYKMRIIPFAKEQLKCEIDLHVFDMDAKADSFRDIVAKVSRFNPDVIMINGFIPQMVNIVKSLRTYNLIKEGNTIIGFDMLDADNVLSADESEGIIVAAPDFIVSPTTQQKKWSEAFASLYGKPPSYHAAFAYDMGMIIFSAINSGSDNIAEAIRRVSYDGIMGPSIFDKDGGMQVRMFPAIYHSGKLVRIQ